MAALDPNNQGPMKQSDMSEPEKKAFAYRANAFMELAKLDEQLIGTAVAMVELSVQTDQARPVKIVIPAAPADLALLIRTFQAKIRQLEIGLGAIVDMILQSKLAEIKQVEKSDEQLVLTTRDPELPEDAQPFLKASGMMIAPDRITPEQFWVQCGQSAETHAGMLRRAMLSQGKGAILRKQ